MKKKIQVLKYKSLIKMRLAFEKIRESLQFKSFDDHRKYRRVKNAIYVISRLVQSYTGLSYYTVEWLYYLRISNTKKHQKETKKQAKKKLEEKCTKI